jgi:DNA-binding NarL/FixJ family response regulator
MRVGTPTLVGRRRELAVVGRALDRCTGSTAVLLEVSGDPGIGKTRLLAELRTTARRRGYVVASGRASEYEQAIAFGAFTDPLDELVEGIDEDQRQAMLAGVGPALAGLAPASVGTLEVFRAVRRLLERLAARTPVVLVLDDLHWADQASTALLRYLVRRPPRAPVLLAIAFRPAQAPPALLAGLGEAAVPGYRIELGPLRAGEADELLCGLPSRSRRHALYRASGGNPFYLLALAELDRAKVALDGPGVTTLPLGLQRVVLAEFAGLSDAGVRAASAAAVAGDVFDPELVGRVGGTGRDAGEGFDEIVARDLVRPLAGGCFGYRHPLLRHAAYHMATPVWRLDAHRRAAVVAAERGLAPVIRARHVERYAAVGDDKAVELLVAAARSETTRAPAIAAHWWRAALRLLPDREEHATLLVELARAEGVAGNLVESRATLHQVLPTLPNDHPLRLTAVTFCATVERLLGHHQAARAMLLDELACDREANQGRAELAVELAAGALMRGDLSENRHWSGLAAQCATPTERGVRATASGFLAMCAYADSDVPAALAHLASASELVDAMPDGELANQLGAALWLGWNEVYLERYRDAVGHLERGLAIARATGQVYLLPLLLACLGLALRWLGRLREASEYAEEAVDAADLTGSADLRALALAIQSWLATWSGPTSLARAAGVAAVRACDGRGGWFAALATAMRARSDLEAGEPDGVAEAIIEAFDGPDLPAVDPRSRISWWVVLVRAAVGQRRLERADEYAARAEALAQDIGLAGHRGHAMVARANVLIAQQDPDAAPRAFAAAEAFAAAGCPLDEARAILLAARALTATGADASEHLARARSLFNACGAGGPAAWATDPGPPAAEAETRLVGLTNRETQTAELVAEGITNREIARRLGISEKTVEKYVSNLLTKLGVAGRAAVGNLVGRSSGAQASQATRRSGRSTTSSPAPS